MQIVERVVGDLTILGLKGRLVAGDGDDAFVDALNRLVQLGRRKVLINLEELTYLDSCGVGAIVSKYISLHKRGGQFKLCNLRTRSFRVLDLTKILTVIESFDSEADAIKSFQETPQA